MDMHIPDHKPSAPLSHNFKTRMLKAIAGTVPAAAGDDPAAADKKIEAMRELLDALDPRDAADAQLAAIAIAAALSAIDGFTRAARAGISDETAVRLRSNALAAGRAYATARQTLRKRAPAPAAISRPSPAVAASRPADVPDQRHDEFKPRDQFGKPVSAFRTDRMTRAQLLATVAVPRDPVLDAMRETEAAVGVDAGAG